MSHPPAPAGAPEGAPAFGGRALAALAAGAVASLVTLFALLGWHPSAPASAAPHVGASGLAGHRTDAGCTAHALRYGITDDAGQAAAQERFERSGAPIPAPGFAAGPLPVTPALHAVLHGAILIFVRPSADPHRMPGLDPLMAYAARTNIAMLVAPHPQRAALTVLRPGWVLSCPAAGAAQVAAARRFAAQQAGILIPPRRG